MSSLVDLAGRDLQNYQLARQLHMLTALYDVFLTNTLSFPLFYESLHVAARQHARTVLLILHRLFSTHGPASALFMQSPYRVYTTRAILSYLVYPEFSVERGTCVSSHIHRPLPGTDASLTPSAQAPPPTLSSPQSLLLTPKEESEAAPSMTGASAPATPLRLASSTAAEVPELAEVTLLTPLSQPQHPQVSTPQGTPLQQPVPASAASASEVMLKPVFYLRPLQNTHTERGTPHFGTTTQIYVRMVHPDLLNEESLNPYFGRYGQVDCTPLQRVPLRDYTVHLGPAATEALQQLFADTTSTGMGDAEAPLYIQDFIISLDSAQNAVHAVRRAYYKELACVAFHDASEVSNTHCIADVDQWMRRHPLVWRVSGDVYRSKMPASVKARAMTAAKQNRRRLRAKNRRQNRRRYRLAVLGEEAEVSSSSSASESGSRASSEGRGGERKRQKGSRASSAEGGSSGSKDDNEERESEGGADTSDSSGDHSGAEGSSQRFVPEIILDGFPYWMTEDQLKVLLQEYGTVVSLRLSLDDLSGAFTGCVLVRMSTVSEALLLSHALHDKLYRGFRLISGVLNERLEVVALEDGTQVRVPAVAGQVPQDVTLNERMWV